MVHWLPAKLSAISSPCHRASINQYAPQAARPRWRGNNTARSHAYLNIQGLLVAADWAPHRCPARPRRWERKRRRLGSLKWGSWLACDSPTRSNWLHSAAGRAASVRVCVFSTMRTRVCEGDLTIPGAQMCFNSRHHYRVKFDFSKHPLPQPHLNLEIRVQRDDHTLISIRLPLN